MPPFKGVSMSNRLNICWFRQDLRLADNPALFEAAQKGEVLPVYILDDENADWALGSAGRWWLHHSLAALNKALKGKLHIYKGKAEDIIFKLCLKFNIGAVFWNRCYEPWRMVRDEKIKKNLMSQGIEVKSFNGSLLWEPWEILKKDHSPYKIFTPYYKQAYQKSFDITLRPLPVPSHLSLARSSYEGITIEDLRLLPCIPWHTKLETYWNIGENSAHQALHLFLKNGIKDYDKGRDFPGKSITSRLSPHLHFGEISPCIIWDHISRLPYDENIASYKRELGWREFSYYLLYHFQDLPDRNLKSKFDNFPWKHNPKWLQCWQKGLTGYPLVDAGMRELWETGFMHNRIRMIAASFLVKNLLIHWHYGAKWFWDCLVDADLASNSAGWQWVAGCGTDASPYFRIFNPVTQGEKFDSLGEYTRFFVPELKNMPDKYLFKPWQAPLKVLEQAGVTLGANYPHPLIDLKISRKKALEALYSLSS